MGVLGHKGITNNCKQCHAYGLSFYNMAPPTLKEPAAGATGHIPAVPPNGTGTIDCVLCHTVAAASFATFAGTVMKHQYVTSMTCMSCHEIACSGRPTVACGYETAPTIIRAGIAADRVAIARATRWPCGRGP